jgi:hypothetical protein
MRRDRGSALLVTLMVIVGLSMLGLGFVAISETEAAIATNHRNYVQTQQVAEAAGRVCVDWFQDPKWALDAGLAPPNDDAIKVVRRLEQADGTFVYQGRYKSSAARLFDKPYKKSADDRFFGTEDNPDILINNTTLPVWLSDFNNTLFNTDPAAVPDGTYVPGTYGAAGAWCQNCDNVEGGVITDIRVYAPPIDGGFLFDYPGWTVADGGIPAGRGFWYSGSRFGLATIRVTATKYNKPRCDPTTDTECRPLATRSMKFVITEFPFPGPQGPIQSNASIDTSGNMKVHWGKITANTTIYLKRGATAVPWHNAWEQANFERGWDVRLPAADQVWQVPPDATNPNQPWTPVNGTIPWLYEFIGRELEDPWYQARARSTIAQMPDTTTPILNYTTTNVATNAPGTPTCNPCNATKARAVGQSNIFQLQSFNGSLGSDYREVIFPKMDYNFWKQIAMAADDQSNIYYLRWVSGDTFQDKGGCQQTFRQWVDSSGGTTVSATAPCSGKVSNPGFYFFDTKNALNPQNSGGGTLTPAVSINGGSMQMKGFVYLNAVDYGTKGVGGPTGYFNMPGETYRDVGYLEVETDNTKAGYKEYKRLDATPLVACNPNTLAGCKGLFGAQNGIWDHQELPWSLTLPNARTFDYAVAKNPAAITRNSSTKASPALIAANTEWFIIPYFPTCATPGVECSEPHEPYLNFVYPTSGNPGDPLSIRWEAKTTAALRRPKLAPGGTLVTCTAASTPDECTGNFYDRDGALIQLAPMLNGVFYNEGTFSSPGNADYFGSILIQGAVSDTGTPNVWFDERLIKDEWPPSNFGFPRVFVSSMQTDQ